MSKVQTKPMATTSPRKALFLDRDGVINEDKGYVGDVGRFEFIDGIFAVVKHYVGEGFLPVVVTNQSGIARGFYSEDDFLKLSAWMQQQFSHHGIPEIHVYYCPHHPSKGNAPYRQTCQCRKPEAGMFWQAQQELNLALTESIMVGDSWRDMQAAEQAGVQQLIFVSDKQTGELASRLSNLMQVSQLRDILSIPSTEAG